MLCSVNSPAGKTNISFQEGHYSLSGVHFLDNPEAGIHNAWACLHDSGSKVCLLSYSKCIFVLSCGRRHALARWPGCQTLPIFQPAATTHRHSAS